MPSRGVAQTEPDSEGERLARIETKLDQLCKLVDALGDYPAVRQQVETNRDEINRLRGEQRLWGFGNSIAAIIAGLIGARQ